MFHPSAKVTVAFCLLVLLQLSSSSTSVITNEEENDEENLIDYSYRVLLSHCSTDEWSSEIESKFKRTIVGTLNAYCRQNLMACNMRSWSPSSAFLPSSVKFLNRYPRTEMSMVDIKFVVQYRSSVLFNKQLEPLVSKAVLFEVFKIAQNLTINGWRLVYTERVPKFDSVTEFMNKALIPVAFGVLILVLLGAKLLLWCTEGRGSNCCGAATKQKRAKPQADSKMEHVFNALKKVSQTTIAVALADDEQNENKVGFNVEVAESGRSEQHDEATLDFAKQQAAVNNQQVDYPPQTMTSSFNIAQPTFNNNRTKILSVFQNIPSLRAIDRLPSGSGVKQDLVLARLASGPSGPISIATTLRDYRSAPLPGGYDQALPSKHIAHQRDISGSSVYPSRFRKKPSLNAASHGSHAALGRQISHQTQRRPMFDSPRSAATAGHRRAVMPIAAFAMESSSRAQRRMLKW